MKWRSVRTHEMSNDIEFVIFGAGAGVNLGHR
jgi:hypothetical protein